LPWPGLCWLIASAGHRIARRMGTLSAIVLLIGLAVYAGIEVRNVRIRERATIGPFPADKTVREASLLQHAITDLAAAGLRPGDRIAFVNPAPQRHYAMADTAASGRPVHTYVPLEGALRGGDAVRLFVPGVVDLGFENHLPGVWEDAQVFLYHDDGTLRALGR